jgi:hypothetical protein
LYAKEAIQYVKDVLDELRSMNPSQRPASLKIVTGMGFHSGSNGPVLMPAVHAELKTQGIACSNTDQGGAIIVHLHQLS